MTKTRTVKDSMGELEVPEMACYGAQTQRAIDNFPISGLTMHSAFLQALGRVKLACAEAFELARQFQAKPTEIGRICNRHDIRICKCQLGCFA